MPSDSIDLYLQQAHQYQQQGQWLTALSRYQAILQEQPHHLDALYGMGIGYFQLGQWQQALNCLQEILKIHPQHSYPHNALGNIYSAYGFLANAQIHYQTAIDLNPNFAGAYLNLGHIYRHQGYLDKALACYQKSVTLAPHDAEAHFHLGSMWQESAQPEAALAHYQQALQLNPHHLEAWHQCAMLLEQLGDLPKAEYCYWQALQQNLTLAALHDAAVSTAAITSHFQRLMAQHTPPNEHSKAWSHFLMILLGLPMKEVFERYAKVWGNAFAPVKPTPIPGPYPTRLRIGYVSPDFCRSSAAPVFDILYRHHDSSAVEIFSYGDVLVEDEVTQRFQTFSAHWCTTNGWSDEQLAQQIRADGIHILVDLACHTRRNRLAMFGRRAAPIQVTGLGFVSTTGLPNMDYRLTDRYISPPENPGWNSERLIYLTSLFHWLPPDIDLPVASSPCLTNGYVTLGCLNVLSKINLEVIRLWAEILHQLPTAKLFLKAESLSNPAVGYLYQQYFGRLGIGPERLVFQGKTPYADHLSSFHQVDIQLDPFPFGGGVTSCDGLWMGVPLLTLNHGLRSGVSLVNQVGHPEWVAQTPAEYVAKAVAMGRDTKQLFAWRQNLRAELLASPICDGLEAARELEGIYRGLMEGC